MREGPARGGDYGTSERFKQAKTEETVVEEEPAPPTADDRRAVGLGKALETAGTALKRAAGRTLVDARPAPAPAADTYGGWASTKDIASGRVYYFNAATKETSWVWPPASLKQTTTTTTSSSDEAATSPSFQPAATFQGRRHGFVFTTRDQGTGYYRDEVVRPTLSDDVVGAAAAAAFQPSDTFRGPRPGYVYTTRDRGTGYYREVDDRRRLASA